MSNLVLLTTGTMKVTGRLVDASNATLLAEISDDQQTVSVIYKPIAGERPLWDFPDGNLASREYAAYLVSEMGKFGVVPLTLLRNGPFGPGAVQQWIDIDSSIDLAELYSQDDSRLRAIALFDVIINNTDRKIGHLLPDSSGHIYGCDHGVTFHSENKLRTVLWQWQGVELNEKEFAQLLRVRNEIENSVGLLRTLLTNSEISALFGRIDLLLMEKRFPEPSKDWPSIPWPPF